MKQGNSLQFFQKYGAQRQCQTPISCRLSSRKGRSHRRIVPMVSCSSENIPASVLESESFPVLSDELDLKNKSKEIEPYLNGRCIYLVGMKGSGKTTVGKVLSEALGYSFYDCDTLIEEAVGGNSVAEIFKLHGETFFRDSENNPSDEIFHEYSTERYLLLKNPDLFPDDMGKQQRLYISPKSDKIYDQWYGLKISESEF